MNRDVQFVALAQRLNTEGRKLRKAVSGIAFSMQEFLAQSRRSMVSVA